MLHEFHQGHNAEESTKIICYAMKCEGTVSPNTVNRWLKKFRSCSNNFEIQTLSGKLKDLDPVAEHQAIEVNPTNNTLRL